MPNILAIIIITCAPAIAGKAGIVFSGDCLCVSVRLSVREKLTTCWSETDAACYMVHQKSDVMPQFNVRVKDGRSQLCLYHNKKTKWQKTKTWNHGANSKTVREISSIGNWWTARLRTCIRAKGGHFELPLFWNFTDRI